MNASDYEHIRTWADRDGIGFRLELYDTYRTDRWGKSILAYEFRHAGELIFEGADYHCSPLHAVDSDAAVAGLLAFLALRPGDTDPDYFATYTPRQLEWVREHGEELSLYVESLEANDATVGAAWYLVRYRCPGCGHEWEEEWSCPCDSECGRCGVRDITPESYERLE